MAYTVSQMFSLTSSDGSTVLYFRPGVAEISRRKIERNQEVTVCESGRQVVSSFTDNEVEQVEVTFSGLQHSDESDGTNTLSGFSSLRSFVRNTAGYRANEIRYKPQGSSLIQAVFAYVDQSELTDIIEYKDESGNNVYSCKVSFRRVV